MEISHATPKFKRTPTKGTKEKKGGRVRRGESDTFVAHQGVRQGGPVGERDAAWVEIPTWNPAFCRYSCRITRAVREMDVDGDGLLSLDEFRVAMEKNGLVRSESENVWTMLKDEDAALLTPEQSLDDSTIPIQYLWKSFAIHSW